MSFHRIWEHEGKDKAGLEAIWTNSNTLPALYETAKTSSTSFANSTWAAMHHGSAYHLGLPATHYMVSIVDGISNV